MQSSITPLELAGLLHSGKPLTLVDVRRKEDHERAPEGIEAAPWRDPTAVDQWMKNLPRDQEVVVYCVRGGSVSQSVQAKLSGEGLTVRFLEGGLEGYSKGIAP